MAISLLLLPVAGAIAAAIALAPLAGADTRDAAPDSASSESTQRGTNAFSPKQRSAPNGATSDYGSSQIPQGWRNDAVWARPGASNPFGTGKRPPVIALD